MTRSASSSFEVRMQCTTGALTQELKNVYNFLLLSHRLLLSSILKAGNYQVKISCRLPHVIALLSALHFYVGTLFSISLRKNVP